MGSGRPLRVLSWIALAAAAAQVVVACLLFFVPGSEGPLGALLYAGMFAAPLAAVGLGLRSARRGWQLAAGWLALVLAAGCALIVAGNWSGYEPVQAVFALSATLPAVALGVVVFWVVVLRGAGRARHRPPAG